MDRDSGLIDLFAIHKEEEHRSIAPAAAPSGPPPAVSFDTHVASGDDADVDALAFAQAKSRKRTKIIGGAIGGVAVLGILIAAIVGGGAKAEAPAAAAAPPPPAATAVVPAPAATPTQTQAAAEPAPPPTAKAADAKEGAYTRSQAIAAYKNNRKSGAKAIKSSGVKMQKIQSSGTN